MNLVPTELFSFERKRQNPSIRYKIDFLCELLSDYLERLTCLDVFLLALEVKEKDIVISYQVPDGAGQYYSFISCGNAIMYTRLVMKHSRRIDLREKYTERLVATELEL